MIRDKHLFLRLGASYSHDVNSPPSPLVPCVQAPNGKRIQLDFTTINLRDKKCVNSYIAVDKSGSAEYVPENSSLFCAVNKSGSVISDGNGMNVAFAGGKKKLKGFSARYTLV